MKITNKQLLVFISIWLLVVIISNVFIFFTISNLEIKKTTGKVSSAEGKIGFCIGSPLQAQLLHPEENAIVSGFYNMTVNTTTAEDNPIQNVIQDVSFYYINETNGENIFIFLGNSTHNISEKTFILELNSSKLPDGNCNSRFRVQAIGNCNHHTRTSSYITINNIEEPPSWNLWQNNITTNFSEYTSWINLTNITIGNEHGSIFFSQINADSADFDNALNISHNYVKLDINNYDLSCFEKSAILTLKNINYSSFKIMKGNSLCVACEFIEGANETYSFSVPSLNDYYYLEEWEYSLEAESETQENTKHFNSPVKTFAYYQTLETSEPVEDGDCRISYILDEEYSSFATMNYNSTDERWVHTRTFPLPGFYDFLVECYSDTPGIPTMQAVNSLFITNIPPVLISELPNEVAWETGTTISPFNLHDYFNDPEDQRLTFSHSALSNILISDISTSGLVSLSARTPGWTGVEHVVFFATDPWGDSNFTNPVKLNVLPTPTSPTTPESTSGGSTGAGGTASGDEAPDCDEFWQCSDWSACLFTGYQVRECKDLNNCGTIEDKPLLSKKCDYIPTCDDRIKNCHFIDGELLCEEGVDCGGPCDPCPSCFDGIQNQGEEGIDCGGPCAPCELFEVSEKPSEEKPQTEPVETSTFNLIVLILFSIFLIVFALKYVHFKQALEQPVEEEVEEHKQNTYISALDRLKELLESFDKRPTDNILALFDETIREFFTSTYNLNYSFSKEDINDLEKEQNIKGLLKIKLTRFSEEFTVLKYSGEATSRLKLKKLIENSVSIITEMSKISLQEAASASIRKFNKKLLEFKKTIRKDVGKATKIYLELNKIYEKLPDEEKEHPYIQLTAVYARLLKETKKLERIQKKQKDKQDKLENKKPKNE